MDNVHDSAGTSESSSKDHMKGESSDSDTNRPSTSSGISHKKQDMAFEKTQKRVGKRPGRKPSKIDVKAKLERSRQSARECRARKKLRYQYLEELVASREKAVFTLRDEVEMYKKWCSDLDRGVLPERLVKMMAQEEMKSAVGDSRAQAMQCQGQRPQRSAASESLLTSMHHNSRSFEEAQSTSAQQMAQWPGSQNSQLSGGRQRADSAPNIAAALASGASRIFPQPSAVTSNATSTPDFTALMYKDFTTQGDNVTASATTTASQFPSTSFPVTGSFVCTTAAQAVAHSLGQVSWVQNSGDGQYANRELSLPRIRPTTSTFVGSKAPLTQDRGAMFRQVAAAANPPTTTQSDYCQRAMPSTAISGGVGCVRSSAPLQLVLGGSGTGGGSRGGGVSSQTLAGERGVAQAVTVAVTCSSHTSTTAPQQSVTACAELDLTASISEPIPHWYSFLNDLESASFSSRQGAFSTSSNPSTSSSGVSTPSGGGSPYSAPHHHHQQQQQRQQPQKQQAQQQEVGDSAGNIPHIISDLVRRSPT